MKTPSEKILNLTIKDLILKADDYDKELRNITLALIVILYMSRNRGRD